MATPSAFSATPSASSPETERQAASASRSEAASTRAATPDAPWCNPNRSPTITVAGRTYLRIPVRSPRLVAGDNLPDLIDHSTTQIRRPGDIVFVSEKAVAVTQGRAVPVDTLKIGLTARLLWRCVRKVPYGVGLRSPSSMQCAVNECGAARIWLAALASGIGKCLGRRGDFYKIAGMQAATIDAAGTSPLQMDCVILGPKDPDLVAAAIRGATGLEAAVVDVNDIGGSWVLGCTGGINRPVLQECLRDNPLGQKDEQTPFGLLRPLA